MPMFIITGSMISAAILSPSASQQPLERGGVVERHDADPLATSLPARPSTWASPPVRRVRPWRRRPGSTEYMSWSTWPWYEPSILAMTSRPVAARATRIAVMFDSVPELVNRTWSHSNRRHSSSASATRLLDRHREVHAVGGGVADRLGDHRVGVADGHRPEAVVEVAVLVAVDVPHLGADAPGQVQRVGIAELEARRDPARHRLCTARSYSALDAACVRAGRPSRSRRWPARVAVMGRWAVSVHDGYRVGESVDGHPTTTRDSHRCPECANCRTVAHDAVSARLGAMTRHRSATSSAASSSTPPTARPPT